MDHDEIRQFVSFSMKILFVLLVVFLGFALYAVEATKKSPEEIKRFLEEDRIRMESLARGRPENENLPDKWPPAMNKPYPDIELVDQDGRQFKLSQLRGKPIILEYIDFSSPISQAQSGAREYGVYGASLEPDAYAKPFMEVVQDSLPIDQSISTDDITRIKIIVYGADGAQGSTDDALNWANHFKFDKTDRILITVPVKDMRDREMQNMIGGYQLLDQNMLLRVDSSGVTPKHNLEMTLVPMAYKLLQ